MKWAGISFTQLSQRFGDVQAKLFPLEKDLVVFQHFLSPDRATRVSFLDPYDEYLVGFSKTVSLLSCLSIFSFQRVIKITKRSFSIMVLRASAPGRQILFAVSLWIYLSLQILGQHGLMMTKISLSHLLFDCSQEKDKVSSSISNYSDSRHRTKCFPYDVFYSHSQVVIWD